VADWGPSVIFKERNRPLTDPHYTHICVIADRSGSMAEMADPPRTKAQRTTEGVHKLVEDQRALPGKTTFSLSDFDTSVQVVERFGDGTASLAWRCSPRSSTALLDAVGTVIKETGYQLENMPEHERPGKVYVVVGTDGLENASHEYTLAQVKDMITEQREKYGWQVVFIGADIDAFAEAGSMGVSRGSTMTSSAAGFGTAYLASSSAMTRSRNDDVVLDYSAEERQQVKDAEGKK
jgi:hypothetical protein